MQHIYASNEEDKYAIIKQTNSPPSEANLYQHEQSLTPCDENSLTDMTDVFGHNHPYNHDHIHDHHDHHDDQDH